jgi:hypothetical protein
MRESTGQQTRRGLLASVAGGVCVVVSGCIGGGSDSDGNGNGTNTSNNTDPQDGFSGGETNESVLGEGGVTVGELQVSGQSEPYSISQGAVPQIVVPVTNTGQEPQQFQRSVTLSSEEGTSFTVESEASVEIPAGDTTEVSISGSSEAPLTSTFPTLSPRTYNLSITSNNSEQSINISILGPPEPSFSSLQLNGGENTVFFSGGTADAVTASTTVTNSGDEIGEFTITVSVEHGDGSVEAISEQQHQLEPGESRPIDETIPADAFDTGSNIVRIISDAQFGGRSVARGDVFVE